MTDRDSMKLAHCDRCGKRLGGEGDIHTCSPKPEQPAPVQIDVHFLRQTLAVAIVGLYEHYNDDVLRVFTLDELQDAVDLSYPLRSQQVEDIYKRAWVMLAEQPAPQPAPQPAQRKPLTDEQIQTLWNEWKDAVCLDHNTWARAIEAAHGIKEKNNG